MSELKPCPFCGSKEVITVADLIYEGDIGIECQNCGIQFFAPTNYSLIEDEKGYMITMWNRRADNG